LDFPRDRIGGAVSLILLPRLHDERRMWRNGCYRRRIRQSGNGTSQTAVFPWDEVPRYLIRDRDTSYSAAVTWRQQAMGIRDRPITPRSPWQNGHVERLIGFEGTRPDAPEAALCPGSRVDGEQPFEVMRTTRETGPPSKAPHHALQATATTVARGPEPC
jgi:hypothetical protein